VPDTVLPAAGLVIVSVGGGGGVVVVVVPFDEQLL